MRRYRLTQNPVTVLLSGFLALLGEAAILRSTAVADVVLPGTQPRQENVELAATRECSLCHSGTKNGAADPFVSWRGGMMSQAARDPVFRAALAVANQDVEGVGEFCIRCHAPRGWLAGRSATADASALDREDLNGVTCDLCHRLVDPRSEEARRLVETPPPGYGNAMYVVDPTNTARGPYGDGTGVMPHPVEKSGFLLSGRVCGTCHNVSNPLQAADVTTQPPHAFGHIERTYSEWELSDFSSRGSGGTCQSCHYPVVPGGGQASRYGELHRDDFVMHGPVGGSTWVQDATFDLWSGVDLNRTALEAAKQRARELLRTAARLDLKIVSTDVARLRITNNTGHKLPTGYPEGRRMWVNIVLLDRSGRTLRETGRYGSRSGRLFGNDVSVPTLLDPEEARVYECVPGLSAEQAKRHGKEPGKSFHFVLNDIIVKDNRIPPEGFTNAAFAKHLCAPVGATYADGQHWDEFDFNLVEGTERVHVRLMYQSVSWEYIKFLAEENRSDKWGRRLYEAWTRTGHCAPEVIAEVTKEFSGGESTLSTAGKGRGAPVTEGPDRPEASRDSANHSALGR